MADTDNDTNATAAVDTTQAAPQEASPEQVEVPTEASEASPDTTYQELAAKKGFKSPEDLAKAYANLERQNTKTAQRKANLESMFFHEQRKNDADTSTTPTQHQDAAIQELDKFVNERADKKLEAARAEFRQEIRKMELRSVIKENADFSEYADDVKGLVAKYPDMPFSEALTFAKAQRGALYRAGKEEGQRVKTEVLQKQAQAQVVAEKTGSENKVQATDLLDGANRRWKADSRGGFSEQTRAEIELLETQLFGGPLNKTSQGI